MKRPRTESRARSLSFMLRFIGRDRRLALGPELVRASSRWHIPRFERGTGRRRAVSDEDVSARGEQLLQLLLGDCVW